MNAMATARPSSLSALGASRFVVYGAGAIGRKAVDMLLAARQTVDCLVDRKKFGSSYRDIPVLTLTALQASGNMASQVCVVGLHNNYLDQTEVLAELAQQPFKKLLNFVEFSYLCREQPTRHYWLDSSFDFGVHADKVGAMSALLADAESRELLANIWQYRRTGNYALCPKASPGDEYKPVGLPRFQSPLRYIDCGAYDGDSVQTFLDAGYEMSEAVAFEPDLVNYRKLANRFPHHRVTALPLGVWSTATKLNFAADNQLSSSITDAGNTVIQCVSLDEALNGFAPNLIKFDIEGAEIEALKGAEKTIRQHRPSMCISLYHAPEHLFEIPLLVASWGCDYKMYLRTHEQSTFGTVLYCYR
jgi:FkbM family methyltransferase